MRASSLFFLMVWSVVLLTAAHAATEIAGFVTDDAHLFTQEENEQLTALAVEIFDSGAAEYAIVTVPSLEGKPIETYAIELAQGNLGDTEKDNGLLLLIALEEREYRFEVGSGLEGTLNDAKAGRIGRDYLVPSFREGRYGEGTLAASVALRDLFVSGVEPAAQAEDSSGRTATYVWWGIIGLFILLSIIGNVQRARGKKNTYFDAADGIAMLMWGRGPGGGFGGGGSFGGGGFGGGGFSGGGSSGGW